MDSVLGENGSGRGKRIETVCPLGGCFSHQDEFVTYGVMTGFSCLASCIAVTLSSLPVPSSAFSLGRDSL